MENVPAPRLAIGYYGMSADAKLVDLIKHVRADEQQHSEVNHCYADGGRQATQLAVKDNAFRERAANVHPSEAVCAWVRMTAEQSRHQALIGILVKERSIIAATSVLTGIVADCEV